MKILMISSYLPYPLFSGGQVRLYNLIKELSKKHEITLICEQRQNQTKEDIAAVEKICKRVITVKRKKQWSLNNIMRAGFSTQSFLITGHTHSQMKQEIQSVLMQESFDLIHVETFYVMQNLPETKIPIVLVEHNIEYKVYERFLKQAPRAFQWLLRIDVAKIRREEEAFWKKADSLVSVSQDDKTVIEQAGFHTTIVANGVDIEQFMVKQTMDERNRVLFIGDFKWIQNRDSVSFIIKDIWPLMKTKFDGKLWIVGRQIPKSIRSLTNDTSVIFDEASSGQPTPQLFQEASVLLAPIRVGGGTSYKILESMSCGTPVVTMPLSANALEARDGQELMVGSTAEELGEKTISLLKDISFYEKISKQGRHFVEKHYTWIAIAKKLDEVYERTIKQ